MADLRGAISAVREGLNGRLFLGSQDGFDFDRFTTGNLFHEATLNRWRVTLARRTRELARRGIPYYFFIIPDAPSVHAEDLPDEVQSKFIAPGQQFIDKVGPVEGVTFIYPLQALRAARGGLPVYQKKDSHWTSYGSYIGYKCLMEAIDPAGKNRLLRPTNLSYKYRRSFGDLGSLMDPEQAEDVPVADFSGPAPAITRMWEGVGRQTAVQTRCEGTGSAARALFFRDSFMTDLAPYVARSWRDLLTVGTTTRVMLDVVDDWRPNVVVSQIAERKLIFYESDHNLESFRSIFSEDLSVPKKDRLFQARLMSVTAPAQAAELIADFAVELPGTSHQAFAAAIVFEAAGLPESARRLAKLAAVTEASCASYLALAARTALANTDIKEATALSNKAAASAPYNGYFQELASYCLLQDGQEEMALAGLENSLKTIHDHPNLWYWASLLQLGFGNLIKAFSHVTAALTLDPSNAVYADLLKEVNQRMLISATSCKDT